MPWTVVKPMLYALGFVVLAHGLYRLLRRFEPVRRVVISYHVLSILLALLLFAVLAPESLGLYKPETLLPDKTPELRPFGKVLIVTVVFFAVLVALRLTDLVLVGQVLEKGLGI
ncbi:MAG TPA: hypothetical protein VMZ92_08015, partial [Planctomycetota bacterium]|nr:hypothetical protein [Planctomycetota bacterium]